MASDTLEEKYVLYIWLCNTLDAYLQLTWYAEESTNGLQGRSESDTEVESEFCCMLAVISMSQIRAWI